MSIVTGKPARPVGYAMFAAVVDAPLVNIERQPDGTTAFTFDRDLDEDEQADVLDFLSSRDDAELATRAALRAAVTGGATNLAEMGVCAWLGDPMPDPIFPLD